MTKITINILKRAEGDMEAIYHYIADELQSPETAMNNFEAIVEGIKTLEIFPWKMCYCRGIAQFRY